MSNVTLAIGGRSFTVACADGEESRIADLGRMIAAKVSGMGDMSGQGESRMLLFAALLLADELHDAKTRAPVPVPAPVLAPVPAPALPGGSAARLTAIAERLENLAGRLEGEAAAT
ncbi:MAG: cell division protein ZapA [Novosphingobium sp.]|jgi:cell division protein ZapA|nr:cell division protein ZapA [Novosphingobium sp.]